MRMIHGRQQYGKVSRFVEELPKHLLKEIVLEKQNKDSWKDARVETDFQKARRMFQTVPDYVGGSSQTTLSKPKPVVYTQVSNQRNFSGSQEKEPLEYVVGDRVRHIKFGTGEVRAIVEGGRDYEITVDFDSVGTKKMFAAFAKLKKL